MFLVLAGFITVSVFAFVLLNNREQSFNFKRNVFDSGQYLFAGENKVSADIDLDILNGSVLSPAAPAFLVKGSVLGALGTVETEAKQEIEEYIAQQGDTLSSVAQKHNISLETVLEANNLTSKSTLKPGQKLVILPVTGMLHIVRQGDSISEIAELYETKTAEIIDVNDLGEQGMIYAGDFLIVPNAVKPRYVQEYVQVPLSQSYFICPIPSPCRVTQRLHWYNAIDFSNGKCGEPVYAAAGGTVQRTGYTSQGGNYVRISHPNNVVTYYGHLSKTAVSAGARVYQGQIIGYVGYTGRTIPAGPAGCHVHFDVRFAMNPFSRFNVGDQLGN